MKKTIMAAAMAAMVGAFGQAKAWTQCFGTDYHTIPELAIEEAKDDAYAECRTRGGTPLRASLIRLTQIVGGNSRALSESSDSPEYADYMAILEEEVSGRSGASARGAFWPNSGGYGFPLPPPDYELWEAKAKAVCLDVDVCNLP